MFVKAGSYLIGLTVVGYVLLKITEPSNDKRRTLESSMPSEHLSDEVRRKHLIVAKLREAAGITLEGDSGKK